jgi:hypothetical protein
MGVIVKAKIPTGDSDRNKKMLSWCFQPALSSLEQKARAPSKKIQWTQEHMVTSWTAKWLL